MNPFQRRSKSEEARSNRELSDAGSWADSAEFSLSQNLLLQNVPSHI
jgi:hypothetical protein